MVTGPDHQGCGATSMLIEWRIDIADKKEVKCAVPVRPTSPQLSLYRHQGFDCLNNADIYLQDKDKYPDKPMIAHSIMIREPMEHEVPM
jgi:GNAT superfamily N-acetyltransferase